MLPEDMKRNKGSIVITIFLLSVLTTAEVDIEEVSMKVNDKYIEKQISKSATLPPCQACKVLVGSFQKVCM